MAVTLNQPKGDLNYPNGSTNADRRWGLLVPTSEEISHLLIRYKPLKTNSF